MSKQRQVGNLMIGGFSGCASWLTGKGRDKRLRMEEDIGIQVTATWVYLHLKDGDEIVKLSRKTNTSAQIYVGMTFEQVIREQVTNRISNSTRCCLGRYGAAREGGCSQTIFCDVHTPEWINGEVVAALHANKSSSA